MLGKQQNGKVLMKISGEKWLFYLALEGVAHNSIDSIPLDGMEDSVSSIILFSSIQVMTCSSWHDSWPLEEF